MTFGGTQGFTRKPSTPWSDDHGQFAGIFHQERNVTYARSLSKRGTSRSGFRSRGRISLSFTMHIATKLRFSPQAYVFLREFILGSNATGLVNGTDVVGGEVVALGGDVLPGNTVIFYGLGTTASSTAVPGPTLASWDSFIATATATTTPRKPSGAIWDRNHWKVASIIWIVSIFIVKTKHVRLDDYLTHFDGVT